MVNLIVQCFISLESSVKKQCLIDLRPVLLQKYITHFTNPLRVVTGSYLVPTALTIFLVM